MSMGISGQHPLEGSNLQEAAGLSEAVSLPRIRSLVWSALLKGTVRGQRIFRRDAGSVCRLAREACGPKGLLWTEAVWDGALKAAMSGLDGLVSVPESALLRSFRQVVVSTAAAYIEGLKQRGREGRLGGVRGRVQAARSARVSSPNRGGKRTGRVATSSWGHGQVSWQYSSYWTASKSVESGQACSDIGAVLTGWGIKYRGISE
jgi:hypothetical protein